MEIGTTEATESTKRDDKKALGRVKGMSDEAEREINIKLDRMARYAEAWKWKVAGEDHERWKEYTDMFLGGENHWKGYPGVLSVHAVNNRIGRNVRVKEALLKEMNIATEAQPMEPGDELGALLVDIAKEVIVERRNVREHEERMGLITSTLGTSIGKVSWNDQLDGGIGDVDHGVIPSEDFFVNRGCTDFDDLRYCFYRRRMDPAEAKSKWGVEVKDANEASDSELFELTDTSSSVTGERMYNLGDYGEADLSTTTTAIPASDFMSDSDEHKEVTVEDWYIESEDSKTGWRHIIRVGKRIVEDGDSKYKHGKVPFYALRDELDAKNFWADTTVRQVMEKQKELNVIESLIELGLHLTTNTGWINPRGSGVSNRDLQRSGNRPNAVINVNHLAVKPERISPQGVSGNLFEFRDMLIGDIDKNMRTEDVVPPGARGWPSSGEVVEQMRESQLVEIRYVGTRRAQGIKRRDELIIGTLQQFYASERYARIVGDLPVALEGLYDPRTGEDVVVTPDEKSPVHFVKLKPEYLKIGVDLKIVEATWRPLSQKAQIDKLLELNERDSELIKIADILECMDLGHLKSRILRRIKASEQAAAEPPPEEPPMDPMMAGGGGMPPGPGMMPPGMAGPPMMPPMGGM